jgi:hypothetical protein
VVGGIYSLPTTSSRWLISAGDGRTGQSGASPDSLVPSDFCALTSARHCSSLFLLTKQQLARREPLLRWLTGQSGEL